MKATVFTELKRKISKLLNKPFFIRKLTIMDLAVALFFLSVSIIFRDSKTTGVIGGMFLFYYGYIKQQKLQKDIQDEEIESKKQEEFSQYIIKEAASKESGGVCEEYRDAFKEMGFIPKKENDNNLVILEGGERASSDGLEFMKELSSSIVEQMMDSVYVLDAGSNFGSHAAKYGKKYIYLVKNQNISINVFNVIDEACEGLEEDSLMMLTLLIEIMVLSGKKDKQKDGEINRDLIKEGVKAIWKEKRGKAGISDLIKWMSQINGKFREEDAKYMACMLSSYDDKGEYGEYFNGSTNIDISGKWSGVSFEGIEEKTKKVLVAGVLTYIFIRDRQSGEKSHKSIVLRDLIGIFKSKEDKEFIERYWGLQRKERKEIITNIKPDDEILGDMVGERVCCLSYDEKSIKRLAELEEDRFIWGKNIWTDIWKAIKEEGQCIDKNPEYLLTSIVTECTDKKERRVIGIGRRKVDHMTVKDGSL